MWTLGGFNGGKKNLEAEHRFACRAWLDMIPSAETKSFFFPRTLNNQPFPLVLRSE